MSAERAQRTREALLDAAEELFAERGFAGVSNREIVARAGANVAAIGYHFGSKRGLYVETVRRSCLRPEALAAWETLQEPPADAGAAAALLAAFLRQFAERILADEELACGTLLMLREAIRPSEALGDVVEGFTRPHEELLAGAVGRVAPDLSPEERRLAARSVLAQVLFHRLYRPFLVRHGAPNRYDPADVARVADHLVRFSLRGLGCSDELVERALASRAR